MIAHTKYRQFVKFVDLFLTAAMLATKTPTVTIMQNRGLINLAYKDMPTRIVLVNMLSLRLFPFLL